VSAACALAGGLALIGVGIRPHQRGTSESEILSQWKDVGLYGPARLGYQSDAPPTYVTLNSIIDDPQVGDERKFLGARYLEASTYQSLIYLESGETIELRVFYKNDVVASRPKPARATRLRVALPRAPRTNTWATAHLISPDARPREVTAVVKFASPVPLRYEYVRGSARIWNNALRGVPVGDNIVTTGVPLGYERLDGLVPSGRAKSSGWVTLRIRLSTA
jgi:hypothetical protein